MKIKADFVDLGPHNGMGEFDNAGSYRAFKVYDKGHPGDITQSLTFVVPAHQLPTYHAQAELKAAVAAEREACENACFERYSGSSDIAYDHGVTHCIHSIRARIGTDPLTARDARVRAEALREAMWAAMLYKDRAEARADVTRGVGKHEATARHEAQSAAAATILSDILALIPADQGGDG